MKTYIEESMESAYVKRFNSVKQKQNIKELSGRWALQFFKVQKHI